MTNQQKQLIATMRRQGISYARIGESLGVSENSVKSFCQRNNLGGNRAGVDVQTTELRSYCKQCGKELDQISGYKPKKFCSAACRTAWWKAHPNHLEQKSIYSFCCAGCSAAFTAYGNRNRKYCSHACYTASRFGNKAGTP